jgi:hypothetical protein
MRRGYCAANQFRRRAEGPAQKFATHPRVIPKHSEGSAVASNMDLLSDVAMASVYLDLRVGMSRVSA